MLYYLGIFVVAALFGFIFGSRQYLNALRRYCIRRKRFQRNKLISSWKLSGHITKYKDRREKPREKRIKSRSWIVNLKK